MPFIYTLILLLVNGFPEPHGQEGNIHSLSRSQRFKTILRVAVLDLARRQGILVPALVPESFEFLLHHMLDDRLCRFSRVSV